MRHAFRLSFSCALWLALGSVAVAATKFSKLITDEFMSADANGDGYVSLREFCFYAAYYQPATLGGLSGSLGLAKATAAFKKADINADGRLSPKEFDECFKNSVPMPRQNATGFAAGRNIVEEPAKPEEQPKDDAFSAGVAKYFSIHKSFLSGVDKDSSDPAKFSWSQAHGSASTYTIDLAVTLQKDYEPHKLDLFTAVGYRWTPLLNGIFEAHVSTIPKTAQNQLLYQGLIEFLGVAESDTGFVQAHHLYIRPGYETDRKSDIRQRRLDLDYTPDLRFFGWGQAQTIFHLSGGNLASDSPDKKWPVTFYWRPIVGTEFHSIDHGLQVLTTTAALPGLENDYGFFRLSLKAEVNIADRLVLSSSWIHRTELYGGGGSHNYLELTAVLVLDPDNHYTIGTTYKRGEDSPTFMDLNTVSAFVGLQF
jgi:EF-hand domain pair/EF hand